MTAVEYFQLLPALGARPEMILIGEREARPGNEPLIGDEQPLFEFQRLEQKISIHNKLDTSYIRIL